jgi:hypothetical protein
MLAMMQVERRAATRVQGCLVATLLTVVVACGEPTSVGNTASSFSADFSGARNERLTGTATASSGGSWEHETVVQVTLPNVGTVSGIVLVGSDLKSTISMIRSGTELPVGTYRLGRDLSLPPGSTPLLTGGYTVHEGDNLRMVLADSGTLTIATTGERVTGSFAFYASRYNVVKVPTRDQIGQQLKPVASGTAPLTITGTFNAGRRQR